jgi:hypothetical protein
MKLEDGNDLTPDEGRLITQAVDSLVPTAEPTEEAEPDNSQAMLELKKKKLQLLMDRIQSGN